MKHAFLKFISPFFIVMLTAGGAAAAIGSAPSQHGTLSQAPETPVDCKKTPDHPRCKDQK
jgi:hypothetical protein